MSRQLAFVLNIKQDWTVAYVQRNVWAYTNCYIKFKYAATFRFYTNTWVISNSIMDKVALLYSYWDSSLNNLSYGLVC